MNRLRTSSSTGAMPVGAIVGIAVALAAIVGLIAGAIWGLSGSSTSPTPTPTAAPTATQPSTSAAPSQTSSDSATPSQTPSDSSSPSTSPSRVPTPAGSAPPAPAVTTTSADGWRLGSWRITNTAGALGVSTTARNTQTGARSADLVLFVYVNGVHIATTTARVTDVPGGGTVPVEFTGTDPWQAGTKVLLLQVA